MSKLASLNPHLTASVVVVAGRTAAVLRCVPKTPGSVEARTILAVLMISVVAFNEPRTHPNPDSSGDATRKRRPSASRNIAAPVAPTAPMKLEFGHRHKMMPSVRGGLPTAHRSGSFVGLHKATPTQPPHPGPIFETPRG